MSCVQMFHLKIFPGYKHNAVPAGTACETKTPNPAPGSLEGFKCTVKGNKS